MGENCKDGGDSPEVLGPVLARLAAGMYKAKAEVLAMVVEIP